MQLAELVLPSFAQMLAALAGQLDKIGAGEPAVNGDDDAPLALRLAPDMLPLSFQVQFVCTQAEEARARIFREPIRAVETPQSMAAAKALISETIARLGAASAAGAPSRDDDPIELKLPNGMIFDLPLGEYVRSWAIPQFYFHLVAAYAILRHHGVALGKADYVPHMLRFLRSGAA